MNTKLNNAIGNINEKFIDEALGETRRSRFRARYVLIPSAAAAVAAGVFAAVNFGGAAPDRGVSLVGESAAADSNISELISSAAESFSEPEDIADDAPPAGFDIPENYSLPAPQEYASELSVYLENTAVPMPEGTPVYAAYDGEVMFADYYHGWGNCLQIRLDDGNFVRYGHLGGFSVEKGERVAAGQVVGYSGISGMTAEPALAVRVYTPDDSGRLMEMTMEEVKNTPWNTMSDEEIIATLNTYKCDFVGTYADYDGENELYFIETSDRDGRIRLAIRSFDNSVDMLSYFDNKAFTTIHLRGEDGYLEQEWERIAEFDEFSETAGGCFDDLGLDVLNSGRTTAYVQNFYRTDNMHECYMNKPLTDEVSTVGYIAPIEGASHYYCDETHDYTIDCLREQEQRIPLYMGDDGRAVYTPNCADDAPVLAVNDGTVVYSGICPLGDLVVIQHADGLRSWYENTGSELSAGDEVKQGDIVGRTGQWTLIFLLDESESADMVAFMQDRLTSMPICPMEWEYHDGEQLTAEILNSLGEAAFDRENLSGYAHRECALDIWRFDLGDDIQLLIGGGYYRFAMADEQHGASVVAEVDIS